MFEPWHVGRKRNGGMYHSVMQNLWRLAISEVEEWKPQYSYMKNWNHQRSCINIPQHLETQCVKRDFVTFDYCGFKSLFLSCIVILIVIIQYNLLTVIMLSMSFFVHFSAFRTASQTFFDLWPAGKLNMKVLFRQRIYYQYNPNGTSGKCSSKSKRFKSPQTKTLLSVRVKTAAESLAAYDRGYPPFLPQQ